MSSQGLEQFRQIIAGPAEAETPRNGDEILEPLRELVVAIRESGVEAELVPRPGGAYTLTLWPQHRPSDRSLMLPYIYERGEVKVLLNEGPQSFRTADELRKFLNEFAGRPEFRAGLAYLRDQAKQPVEAVLRSENESFLVEIEAQDQKRLFDASAEEEIALALTMEDGYSIPSAFTSLGSAGLHFKVISSEVQARTISLRLRKK